MLIAGFEFPDELLVHVEHQVWAWVGADGVATVGITALGVHLAGGEFYLCRPKAVGQLVEQGRGVAVVEVAKAVLSVKSPVTGEVVEVNQALAAAPELVERDPYGAGWIARLRTSSIETDRASLVTPALGREAIEHHAWLHRIEG